MLSPHSFLVPLRIPRPPSPKSPPPLTPPPLFRLLYLKMYDNMIEELDAVDNGVSCYPTDIQPKYTVSSTLAQRVGRLNPYWNQEGVKDMDERSEALIQT